MNWQKGKIKLKVEIKFKWSDVETRRYTGSCFNNRIPDDTPSWWCSEASRMWCQRQPNRRLVNVVCVHDVISDFFRYIYKKGFQKGNDSINSLFHSHACTITSTLTHDIHDNIRLWCDAKINALNPKHFLSISCLFVCLFCFFPTFVFIFWNFRTPSLLGCISPYRTSVK